jgi:hypothetical protein
MGALSEQEHAIIRHPAEFVGFFGLLISEACGGSEVSVECSVAVTGELARE